VPVHLVALGPVGARRRTWGPAPRGLTWQNVAPGGSAVRADAPTMG
jgi:hypothetical protein